MNTRCFSLLVLTALVLCGCAHQVSVSVSVYQPRKRMEQLKADASAADAVDRGHAASVPLSRRHPRSSTTTEPEPNQSLVAELQRYLDDIPPPEPDSIPQSTLRHLLAVLDGYEQVAEAITAANRVGLTRLLVAPEETKRVDADTKLRKAELKRRRLEDELRPYENWRESNLPTEAKDLRTQISDLKAEIVETTRDLATVEIDLSKRRAEVASIAGSRQHALAACFVSCKTGLAEARSKFERELLAAASELDATRRREAREQASTAFAAGVASHMKGFLAEFHRAAVIDEDFPLPASAPDVVLVPIADRLNSADSLILPEVLQVPYRSFGPIALTKFLTMTREGTDASGSAELTDRLMVSSLSRRAIVAEEMHVRTTDGLVSIARRDEEGWIQDFSHVVHRSTNRADLLLVRNSPADYSVVSLDDRASSTVSSTARAAVVAAAVTMEVAQLVTGVPFGAAGAPAGGIPGSEQATLAAPAISPENLRALAQRRLERAQALTASAPASDASAAQRSAWISEVRGFLDSCPNFAQPHPTQATTPSAP